MSNTADREIVFSRLLDAPQALVYEAFTNPEHVTQWWGPNGFTNTTLEMDVRPGGVWRILMHGPDGVDYPNKMVFKEVDPPARLTYSHGDDGGAEEESFEVTVTFEAQGDKTLLTMQLLFPTAAECQRVAERSGAFEGGKQTLARLAHYLTTMSR